MELTFSSFKTHGNHRESPTCKPPNIGLDTLKPHLPSWRNSAFVADMDCVKASGIVRKWIAQDLAIFKIWNLYRSVFLVRLCHDRIDRSHNQKRAKHFNAANGIYENALYDLWPQAWSSKRYEIMGLSVFKLASDIASVLEWASCTICDILENWKSK